MVSFAVRSTRLLPNRCDWESWWLLYFLELLRESAVAGRYAVWWGWDVCRGLRWTEERIGQRKGGSTRMGEGRLRWNSDSLEAVENLFEFSCKNRWYILVSQRVDMVTNWVRKINQPWFCARSRPCSSRWGAQKSVNDISKVWVKDDGWNMLLEIERAPGSGMESKQPSGLGGGSWNGW